MPYSMKRIFILSICFLITLMLTGCSRGPESTVKAFWKAIVDGDVSKASSYVTGDPLAVGFAQITSLDQLSSEGKRTFFSYCEATLLEQNENTAKVRWKIDFDGLMGGVSWQTMGYSNEEATLMSNVIKAITIFEFTLTDMNGKWMITATDFPNLDMMEGISKETLINMRKAHGR